MINYLILYFRLKIAIKRIGPEEITIGDLSGIPNKPSLEMYRAKTRNPTLYCGVNLNKVTLILIKK